MTSGLSLEILDLRHFNAALLRPLLEAEGEVWRRRLHWEYGPSARLLMQYLDGHMLPGYAALENGRVTGYAFCVYEETKAVIGDVYAAAGAQLSGAVRPGAIPAEDTLAAQELEDRLLVHLFETLQSSPQIDRVESQLLLHPSGEHATVFRKAGFTIYGRLFMVQKLSAERAAAPKLEPPRDVELRPWRDDDLSVAGQLISEAYADHPDSLINDQYRSSHGSMRFLHNIVRYSGCGTFAPQVSFVVCERASREMVGLVLGSRVSAESGHITQLCIRPNYRRRGLARMLLNTASAGFWRLGMSEVSLTVTEANLKAIELYHSEGFECRHMFDAAVWQRQRMA